MENNYPHAPASKKLSRRTFLAGAGMGALGLAAAGIAGCAPASAANGQANGESGKKNAAPSSPADKSKIEMTQTEQVDILVVGTGASGLTAAISAAENGGKVTVIEKSETLKMVYGHSITAVGTTFQQEAGEDWTPEELVDFWNQFPDSDAFMDREAQLFAAQHSGESIEWLIAHGVDIVGVTIPPSNPFQKPARTFVTSADRDGVKAYLEPLKAKAEELGVQFRFATEATKIVTDDKGAVIALETVCNGTGTRFELKSLIVAAGGYGASADLVRLYAPRTPISNDFEGPSQGFALLHAAEVSAEVVAPGGTMSSFSNADGAFSDNPGTGMFVTREGKRWVNENLYVFDRNGIGYKQGIGEYWTVYDAPLYEQVAAKASEKGLEAGSVLKADTIEGLAKGMNVNLATFSETVAAYNGYCQTGIDEEFGKPASRMGRVFDPQDPKEYDLDLIEREFKLLNPVSTPPFYAIHLKAQTSTLPGTAGGMRTNTSGEVLGIDGNPVPNLYAVGESANGHLVGYFYPQSGTSLCMCFCFGRYAGIAAAENAAS